MVKLYATTVKLSSSANTDPYNGGHHKEWDYLNNLKNSNGIAYCRHTSVTQTSDTTSQNYEAYMIAGRNGTLKQPAPFDLNFDTSSLYNAEAIKSIIVHYKHQTFDNAGSIISIAPATVTILGANTSKTASHSLSRTLQEENVTFTNITKSQVLSNDFGVRIAFPANTADVAGRMIVQDVYIEVITGTATIKYPQSVAISDGVTCGSTDYQYKCWDNLDNLHSANGTAYCRHPNYESPLIAGKNGTYKQPAPLTLKSFGFDIPSDATVEKVVFHYKTQKFINNGYYPDIGGATISLLGTSQASKKGKAVSSDKVEDTITWTGVTTAQLNSSNFGVKIAFPANESTTPGRIILENTYLEVYIATDSTKITVNSKFSKNPITVGETVEATFTVNKTSSAAYQSTTIIDLPLGVDIDSQTINFGTCTTSTVSYEGYSFKRITWNHTLAQGNTSNTVAFLLRAVHPSSYYEVTDTSRVKKCIIKDKSTEISYTNYLTINDVACTLTSNFYEGKVQPVTDKNYSFSVNVKTTDPSHANKVLYINTGGGGTLSNLTSLTNAEIIGTGDNGINGNYWIKFRDDGSTNITFNLKLLGGASGEYTMKMWVTKDGYGTKLAPMIQTVYLVRDKDLGLLGFTRMRIHEHWTQNMGHGIKYTLGSMIKYVLSAQHVVSDYGANLRIGVYNSSDEYTPTSQEEEFISRVKWCNDMATTTSKEATVQFTYNENNPLYFVYSHQYVGDPTSPYVTFNFSEVILAETQYYSQFRDRGLMITPAPALLGDTKYATGTFTTSIQKAYAIDCYAWDDGGLFNENISILGAEVTFDYILSDKVWVNVELYLDKDHVGSRDIILEKGSGTAHAGNTYDLFGLRPTDFRNKLGKLEVRLTVLNQVPNSAKVQLNNLIIHLKYVKRIECGYGLSIDGEHSFDWGFVVTNVEHNFATNNEKSEYKVSGTDNTIIARENIDSKEITITIKVPDCKLKDNIYLIDRIVEMFTNDRELHSNKPIPKQLIFDHMPDRQWPVVRVDEFDDKIVGNSYEAKIKLIVPDGTSYDLQKTITGARGSSPSSIAIKPEVYYKSNTAGRAEITETRLEQTLIIEDSRIKNGSTLIIDADQRTIFLNGTTDISKKIDFNSSWFRLKGEYEFETDTGTIQSVEYYIRR